MHAWAAVRSRSPVFAVRRIRRFRFVVRPFIRFVLAGAFPALYLRRREKTMTITIINKATRREQQQNGPCPYLIDCPPEPRK